MPALLAVMVMLLATAATSAAALSVRELQYLEDPHTHGLVHALPPRQEDSTRTVSDECSPAEDLTGPGRLLAGALGESIQKAGVRIDHVLAGPRCNAALTARLMKLVPVDIVGYLDAEADDDKAELQRDDAIFYLAGLRPLETALLVTHGRNLAALTGMETVPGEMLIVSVSPLGELQVLYSILP